MPTPNTLKEAGAKGFDALAQQYAAAKVTVRNTPLGRIRWLVRAGLLELGWLGIVGIGIFAMCMAYYFSAMRPVEAKLRVLRDSVTQQERRGVKTSDSMDALLTPEQQLTVFYRSFPTRSSVPTSLEKIYAAAAEGGMSLDQADYKASQVSTGKMTRYQITLPIKGEYSKIHQFLVRVLRDVPTASLERVLFERKKIGDPSVDATVTLVLYLGPEL